MIWNQQFVLFLCSITAPRKREIPSLNLYQDTGDSNIEKKVLSFVFDFKHAKDIKIIYVSKNFTFLEIFLAVLSMSYEQL